VDEENRQFFSRHQALDATGGIKKGYEAFKIASHGIRCINDKWAYPRRIIEQHKAH